MRPLRPLGAGKAAKPLRSLRKQPADDPLAQNRARLAELAKMPPLKLPPLTFPAEAEAAYERKLRKVAAQAFDFVRPVIAELQRLQALADAEQARADGRAEEQNKPHTPAEKAQLTLPLALRQVTIAAQRRLELFAKTITTDLPAAIARTIERYSSRMNLRVFESIGVNPIDPGSELDRARADWLRTNNELIVSQPLEVRDRIGRIVEDMVKGGSRWETIAERLMDEEGIAERRASLIARDQVSKYNADCNRTQQQAAGFTHYEWMGVGDNRERPEHLALNHTIWSWEKPPPVGNPGEPILCRCWASLCTSNQQMAQAQEWTAEEYIDRVVAVGPTQAMGPDATEAEIRKRAVSAVASEIRLAGRRSEVAGR